jgi:hypothetical protein
MVNFSTFKNMRVLGIAGVLSLTILIALFIACSDDNNNPTYPFERTVLDISIVKRCIDGSFAAKANCYLMRWQPPIEKNGLQSYYIWLDNVVVKDSVQSISEQQMNQADKIIPYNGKGTGDSLDLTDLLSKFLERDSLHIAIWAKYSGSEQGAVQHIYIYFGDDIKPAVVHFTDSTSAGAIWLNWVRPTDQREFYLPDELNGPIAGYNINIQATDKTENIRDAIVRVSLAGTDISASNLEKFYEFKKDGRGVALKSIANTNIYFLGIAVIDGKGFANESIQNSWKMTISGLKPEHSYKVSIVAYDSAGNFSLAERYIATTDPYPPLIANKFWLYKDSGDGHARLDSNRLILFWPRSVDPLTNITAIELDSTLRIPSNYLPNVHYREVKNYSIEQWSGTAWEVIPKIDVISEGYYNARYNLENDSMQFNVNGMYVSDTLRYILPGAEVILRIRAIDSSGHYSKAWEATVAVSKGKFWQYECPPNFGAVMKPDSSVFCIEKTQHLFDNKNFKRNVLYTEAKSICNSLGFYLCTEQEWNAACNSNGVRYGVIEERGFEPANFLSRNCGVGTGDSLSAKTIDKRNKICASPDGIRDLPGQLQEWVAGTSDTGEIPLLKGSSYAAFSDVSIAELAQCKNNFSPTRIRPRYYTDSVYLYRSGSRIDTLPARDSLRANPYAVLPPNSLPDTILRYTLSLGGEELGIDYVDQADYRRRGGKIYLDVLWQGLDYKPKDTLQSLILGTESINASKFFLDPTVGFRCCAQSF